MGLERTAAVLQDVISDYHTDLFLPLLQSAARLADFNLPHAWWSDPATMPTAEESQTGAVVSLQVIADHSRSATFLIADGVLPSNEGRGYVLRKILRRAIQHGHLLGRERPFLHLLVD